MTGDGSEFLDSADESDKDRDDEIIEADDVDSRSDQSAFIRLVNDPAIVVYRRRVSDNARLRWITHNVHDVLGYRSEDLLRSEFGTAVDTWSGLVHRDSVDRYRRFLAGLLSVDKARCLYQILAADGGYRFIREEARVVRNSEEEAVDIVGCLIDWTDLTTIRYHDSIGDYDGGSLARRYRMRELELVADLLATHSYIRQQARSYRDVVQTLTQITDRLQASVSQGAVNGLVSGESEQVPNDANENFDGGLLPIGIYHAQPTASRMLSRVNKSMALLVNLERRSIDRSNLSGFELSSVTTPDIARTNEETVDLAMRTREDFDLVYPVVEQTLDTTAGGAGWTRWIWEQGRVEYNAENQPVAIHGVVADVTDSMASENANIESGRQSKIPFETAFSNIHFSGQRLDRDTRAADSGHHDLFDVDNSLNEFMAGPIREPMGREDEVVAVFSSSNMLETDHPTVELAAGSDDMDSGQNQTVGNADSGKSNLPFQELSAMGVEIASWDSDETDSIGADLLDKIPDFGDFDYFGEDMPYYLDSLSDNHGRTQSTHEFSRTQPGSASPADQELAERIQSGKAFEQFRLFAQPAFAVGSTAAPIYLEVLLRLQDDDGNLLAPAEFNLRRTDARTQIAVDQWVVHEAINSLSQLSDRESDVAISVNISSHTLSDESFADRLKAQLKQANVSASRISFEINDPQVKASTESLAAMLNRVDACGCRVILDNFSGDGITLQQLRNLAIDQVKIDGELVRNYTLSEVDRSIISSICQVAREQGISVTAQHVEHVDAVDGLAALGVDNVQGNGLAEVLPIELYSHYQSEPVQPNVAH